MTTRVGSPPYIRLPRQDLIQSHKTKKVIAIATLILGNLASYILLPLPFSLISSVVISMMTLPVIFKINNQVQRHVHFENDGPVIHIATQGPVQQPPNYVRVEYEPTNFQRARGVVSGWFDREYQSDRAPVGTGQTTPRNTRRFDQRQPVRPAAPPAIPVVPERPFQFTAVRLPPREPTPFITATPERPPRIPPSRTQAFEAAEQRKNDQGRARIGERR